MAWPLDQSSWEQEQIYWDALADASGLIPSFVPDTEPAVATNYGAYSNPPTNDAHHLGHGHQYYAMPASVPSQWAAIAGPNIPTPITEVTNDPHSAANQPPIVAASSHSEPKPRTRKKNSSRVTEYATISVTSSPPTNSITNHCPAQTPTPVPLRLLNASGKAAATQALSIGSMSFSVTFGRSISPPWLIHAP